MALPTLNDVSAVNPVLQNMLISYMQSQDRFIAGRVFPYVPVAEESGTYYIFDQKYFALDDMPARAAGGDFGSLEIGVSTDTYATSQNAAQVPVADETEAANQAPWRLEEAAMERLAQASLIRQERLFAAQAMVSSTWVDGSTDWSGTKWSTFATSDPVGDVLTGKRTISQTSGQTANTFAMGEIVEQALLNHPDIIDRLKNVIVASEANVSNALAGVLGVANIHVGRAIYNSANEGQAGSYSAIVDDDALLCAVSPGADMRTATAGKCFVWGPGGGSGSMYLNRDDNNHRNLVQHKHQLVFKRTAIGTGYFFPDVVD